MQNNQKAPETGVFTSLPSTDDACFSRDQLLKDMRDDSSLPALGSSVTRVVQLASSDSEAVRELAYFVLSDVALTQKVLRMANTVYYRSMAGGSPVTTISKAIFILGFDTIKTSALAMLLVDRMSGKRGQSVRAELAHALTASVVGRELARRSHFKDAEEAAVAALFKNIGRVLVAAHDHKQYSEISTLIDEGKTPALASMQVLGCSYDMLADAILQDWQIPDTIIKALTPLPSGVLRPAKNRHEWMQQVAAFSAAAATLIPHKHERGGEAATKALLTRFGGALELDGGKLDQLFATVAQETRALTLNANLPLPPETSADFAGAGLTAAETDSDAEAEEAQEAGLPAELLLATPNASTTQIDQRYPSGKPLNARELLLAGVQDVTEMMASGRMNVNDLIMLVLETFHRSLGFRFATICLKDVKANQYRARIALGGNNTSLQAAFTFPDKSSSRDLFHLALENDADLLISDASDAKIRDLIPAWHKKLLPDARSFIVLPLIVHKKPFGLFYADRTFPAGEGVPPDETALIKTLKGQVLAALNSR